ncbi:MAG: methyltransferase domain-containing protein [Oligoflexales bacterium]
MLKLIRYSIFTALDLMRALPFLLVVALPHALGMRRDPVYIAKALLALFLFRKPEADDVNWLSKEIETGKLTPFRLCLSFFMMPEGLETRLFAANGNAAHHAAREYLIQNILPSAEAILDLGGSSTVHNEGALLGMGYQHNPKKIIIVDLPPIERTADQQSLHTDESTLQFNGIEVRHVFGTMDRLDRIRSQSIDLVWSGQSVEHIDVGQAQKMFQEVWRVLQPGGKFCLDTPNRALSKMLCRMGFIHPEHKIEYMPSDLRSLLTASGFKVRQELAVSPMPLSLKWRKFCKLELHNSKAVSRWAAEGFSFFVECEKPS